MWKEPANRSVALLELAGYHEIGVLIGCAASSHSHRALRYPSFDCISRSTHGYGKPAALLPQVVIDISEHARGSLVCSPDSTRNKGI
jgi:hypothetical protein